MKHDLLSEEHQSFEKQYGDNSNHESYKYLISQLQARQMQGKPTANAMILDISKESDVVYLATQLFVDEEVQDIDNFASNICIILKKTRRINTWTSNIQQIDSGSVIQAITAVTLKSWKAMLNDATIPWILAHHRDIITPMPEFREGFCRTYNHGRWTYAGIPTRISLIISTMLARSYRRGHDDSKEDIDSVLADSFKQLFDAQVCKRNGATIYPQDPVLCQCKAECTAELHLFGSHVVSPDRQNDDLGYTDVEQTVLMISAHHNTVVKRTAVPKLRNRALNWIDNTAGGMKEHTKTRMATLEAKQFKTEADQRQITFYNEHKDDLLTRNAYKELLKKLKAEQSNCALCQVNMHFGGENGMLTHSNVWQQASPDRLSNDWFYLAENVRLVCLADQASEAHRSRIDRIEAHSGDTVPLLMKHREEIMECLKNRSLKRKKI
jgi:hypothetical protein